MIDMDTWFACLARAGVTFYSGVPCSFLKGMFAYLPQSTLSYLPATVEGEALSMAAGVALGGGLGAVLLQNSGLGNTINPLTSLLMPYRLPAVMIISWRAQPGLKDAPHHEPMGRLTLPLLETLDVPYMVLPAQGSWAAQVDALIKRAKTERRPVAIVIPKKTLDAYPAPKPSAAQLKSETTHQHFGTPNGLPLTRQAILEAWASVPWANFATTGHTGRHLYMIDDQPRRFYMQGSMGFASAVALGWQNTTGRPLVVFDGDGALMMRMGSLATIGAQHDSAAFVHLVLDNQSYSSTGGQAVPNAMCDFAAIAAACGYRQTATCADVAALQESIDWARGAPGATLIHYRIAPSGKLDLPRPSMHPDVLADRFVRCFD